MTQYFFITGAGRCGTTLVRSLLDGHSNLNVFAGEISNALGTFLSESGYSRRLPTDYLPKVLMDQILDLYRFDSDYKELSERFISNFKKLNSTDAIDLTSYLQIAEKSIFNKTKSKVVVDLTHPFMRGILDEFKGAKVIHMLRNPYEQLNSVYRFYFNDMDSRPFGGPYPGSWHFGDNFTRIRQAFDEAEMLKSDERVKILRLEDLQSNPKLEIDRLLEFLGEKPEEINYRVTRRGIDSDAGSTHFVTSSLKQQESDRSCLTKNDMHLISLIKNANFYYNHEPHAFHPNNYLTFLARQLGFIGKNRKKPRSILKIIKIIVISFVQYISDKRIKFYFKNFMENR